MPLLVFILDSRPSYADGCSSLLELPLGGSTLGAELTLLTAALRPESTYIVPTYPGASGRVDRTVAFPVLARGEYSEVISRCEPSDTLLLIDPRYYPVAGMAFRALLAGNCDCRWAAHAVALPTQENASERVVLGLDGTVERIQRYYDGVTWPQRGEICCTTVSAAALLSAGRAPFERLTELRYALAAQGVLSRDVALWPDAVDLTCEAGLLALNATVLQRTNAGGRWDRGRGVSVAPSARLSGPIAIQEGATIEDGAVVIGPTIVGGGARIGRGALVAQSILARGANVAAGTVVRQRFWSGGSNDPHLRILPGAKRRDRSDQYRVPVLNRLGRSPMRRGAYESIKCAIETLLALLALLALAPLMLLIGAVVRATSAGPALFGHEREGRNGGVFCCYKFRTMSDGAHAQQRALYARSIVDGPQFKLPGDPRITSFGRFLRRTNLDELPQLINVVLGHMSLIGPRPSPFRENQLCVSWRRARLSVRPGITGLWQLCRHDRDGNDFHQWIHYDLLYVRHMSAWLDLKILLATLLTLGGRWSVPLSWMIRDPKVDAEPRDAVQPRHNRAG